MRHILPLLVLAILTACANIHPVKTVGPDTYQLTHTMGKSQPAQGVRNALVNLAEKKCAVESGPFTKLAEDTAVTEKRQTLSLTFTCKPVLKSSAYTGSFADTRPTASVSYTAPMNLQPSQLLVK